VKIQIIIMIIIIIIIIKKIQIRLSSLMTKPRVQSLMNLPLTTTCTMVQLANMKSARSDAILKHA